MYNTKNLSFCTLYKNIIQITIKCLPPVLQVIHSRVGLSVTWLKLANKNGWDLIQETTPVITVAEKHRPELSVLQMSGPSLPIRSIGLALGLQMGWFRIRTILDLDPYPFENGLSFGFCSNLEPIVLVSNPIPLGGTRNRVQLEDRNLIPKPVLIFILFF